MVATTSKVPRRSPGSVKLGPGNAGYYQARGREALEAALKATRTARAFHRDTLSEIQATKLRDRLIITTRLEAEALTQQLISGSISLNNWRTKMGATIIPAHHAMVMATTGRTVIDPADRKAFERLVNDQLAFLDRFQRDIKSGRQLLDGTAINRARQYGSAPWALAQNVQTAEMEREGYDQYRLINGLTEHHCGQCPADAAKGWVKIGTLAPIGSRTCRMGCRCRLQYRKEALPAPPEFGPSKAKVVVEDADATFTVADAVRHAGKMVGRKLTPSDLASLAGATDGATVDIWSARSGYVEAKVRGPGYESHRVLKLDLSGKPIIKNESFFVDEGRQGQGLGLQVFGRQVEQAAKLGFSSILTDAAGSLKGSNNGYYTWPRFGYDGLIPEDVRAKLPPNLAGSSQLSDLMQTESGRTWWKENGHGVAVTFDLTEGSLSRRVWDGYRAAKAAKK